MKRLLALLLFTTTSLFAADADVERIAGSILVHGHSMQYARELTDQFGSRLIGSSGFDRAAEWTAAQFRAAGVTSVRLEEVRISRGWTRGTASAHIVAPLQQTLHLTPFGWTSPTPPGGIRADVVPVSDLAVDSIRGRAKELEGRVVLLSIATVFRNGYFAGYKPYLAALDALKAAGARGVLVGFGNADNALGMLEATWGVDTTPPLPIAQLGMEDAKMLERLAANGRVTIDYSYDSAFTPAHTLHNVVAEIRGSERPDEWVAVGGHLDSWDVGSGAQDNGSGCAMVLESARAIAALGRPPRRSIRFILWAGEEEGFLGSQAYTQTHKAELANCIAALNADAGSGHPKGWATVGRTDVADAFRPIAKALLTDLGAADVSDSTQFVLQSDHAFFLLNGIPTLELMPDLSKYFDVHHRSADTIDKIDPHNLAGNAATLAVAAYAVADREQPIAPHASREDVMKILEKTHTDTFVKEMGWLP
ncbi:MAG: putative Peptidase [Acidobacteria bacterium]|nr:putative Peptidase [Acidobacteriota bacterium]